MGFSTELGRDEAAEREADTAGLPWYVRQLASQCPLGFNAGDANLYRYVGNSPTNRVDPHGLDWKPSQVAEYLEKSATGRATLKYLRDNNEKIRVWKSEQLKNAYKKKTDKEWRTYSLYAVTQYAAYKKGVCDITISSKMDALTAAATLVHEVEHARGNLTGKGGSETDARIKDLQFYIELGKEGIKRLPKEYFDKGIVKENKDGTFTFDKEKLKKEAETSWSRQPQYIYKGYDFGKYSQVNVEKDLKPAKK
jgi:hypothetical protein